MSAAAASVAAAASAACAVVGVARLVGVGDGGVILRSDDAGHRWRLIRR